MAGATVRGPDDLVKLARPFRLIAFDWDGTAVMGRQEDASEVCQLLDRLMGLGVQVMVITGTNLANTTNQLAEAIRGRHSGNLYIATNRGSEVYGFRGRLQPVALWRRTASPEEDRQLTAAADALRDTLRDRAGLEVRIIYDRLNRRKVDLIPLAEWADPPKWRIGELLEAVEARLAKAGVRGGVQEVLALADRLAREQGLTEPRVTSDVKHIEIGLTDKADSVEWMALELCKAKGIDTSEVLVAGDEFGPIGAAEGSDFKMVTPHSHGAVFVSVGPEPGGAPEGVIHLGGGPARFRALLAAQVEIHEGRRAPGHVPEPVELPATRTTDQDWLLVEEGIQPAREHEIESLYSTSNGYSGTRGSLAEGRLSSASPATFLAGVFDTPNQPQAVPELAVAPDWTQLRVAIGGHELAPGGASVESRRVLDLKDGIPWRELRIKDPDGRVTSVRGVRFASLSDRRLLFQSVTMTPENYSGRVRLEALIARQPTVVGGVPVKRPHLTPADDPDNRGGAEPPIVSLRTHATGIRVAMASRTAVIGPDGDIERRRQERPDGLLSERWEFDVQIGETYRLDRMVALSTSRDSARPAQDAARELTRLAARGPARLVRDHAEAWRERWRTADVQVDGDEDAQRALRFALYHLIGAANPEDERVSIGARTLTGESYKGHVFWDTDIFILPFFNYTHPASSRAMLMYRYHTLQHARGKAQAMGYRGALYAWESADTGEETTPRFMLAPSGEVVRILSGDQEHHISADVAWAAWDYYQISGDEEFLRDAGAEIILETARFWASRGRFEEDGRYHIHEVIGPDEYHEGVDDNAYTNLLAQWNLETAQTVARRMADRHPEHWDALRRRLGLGAEELAEFGRVARAMYLSYDESTGLIEQFRGFFDLEDYDLGPMRAEGKRSGSLDLLLGRDRTLRSQIVKQADVVMALFLLWDRFPARVREVNFRYYEPRTCHGSSLSPATHAAVAARLGDLRTAYEYFMQAAHIDLANNMGNAAGGVHAAALGGLWQAAVLGFAGLQLTEAGPKFDPRLPAGWRGLRFPLQYRGTSLIVNVGAEPASFRARVEGKEAARVLLGGDAQAVEAEPGRIYVERDGGWQAAEEAAPQAAEAEP